MKGAQRRRPRRSELDERPRRLPPTCPVTPLTRKRNGFPAYWYAAIQTGRSAFLYVRADQAVRTFRFRKRSPGTSRPHAAWISWLMRSFPRERVLRADRVFLGEKAREVRRLVGNELVCREGSIAPARPGGKTLRGRDRHVVEGVPWTPSARSHRVASLSCHLRPFSST